MTTEESTLQEEWEELELTSEESDLEWEDEMWSNLSDDLRERVLEDK
jgi:hypothetical protein